MILAYVKTGLVYALRTAAGLLRSKLIDYKLDVSDYKELFTKVMKDGLLSDEETADILDEFADQIESK